MSATILLFPAPESRPARSPALPAVASSETVFLLMPIDAGRSTPQAPPLVVEPARVEGASLQGQIPGVASMPSRGAPYSGPCRRRALRSTTSVPAMVVPGPRTVAPMVQPDRLTRSLENLRAALAEQAEAVATWRASLGELDVAVRSLRNGFVRQTGVMDDLGRKVSQLGTTAGTLERTVSRL